MTTYLRPIAATGADRPATALSLAGGWAWFDQVDRIERGRGAERVPVAALSQAELAPFLQPREPVAGLTMDQPQVMGILNVTPDSFSDGGDFDDLSNATAQAGQMLRDGAGLIDIGGESTRPGASPVPPDAETARTEPVIRALAGQVISIDTRNAAVARAAVAAGAAMINDVSAMTHDAGMADVVARAGVPVCLMHAQGDPQTMQDDPRYEDVLLDVYDYLAGRISVAQAAGIPRARIVVDPGIGFGKTLDHNMALLRGLSLFHGLGCPILLGASRKRFIGTIGKAPQAKDRLGGSVAVALHALRQGVQILRVHDTLATKQAVDLQMALSGT